MASNKCGDLSYIKTKSGNTGSWSGEGWECRVEEERGEGRAGWKSLRGLLPVVSRTPAEGGGLTTGGRDSSATAWCTWQDSLSVLFTFGSRLVFEKYLYAYQVTDAELALYECSAHWGLFLLFYSLEGTTALTLASFQTTRCAHKASQRLMSQHSGKLVSHADSWALPSSASVNGLASVCQMLSSQCPLKVCAHPQFFKIVKVVGGELLDRLSQIESVSSSIWC